MYILVNKSRMILGLFSTKKNLTMAIKVVKEKEPDSKFYYQKVCVDNFDNILINFFTMHPEKLIEV